MNNLNEVYTLTLRSRNHPTAEKQINMAIG